MDLNALFWRSEGETFFQRFHHWTNILDPTLLFSSNADIENARKHLQDTGENITESLQDKKIKKAWYLSLASVHTGTGDTIPVAYRPPAFLVCTAPLVIASFLPYRGTKHAFLWQFIFHTYVAGFTLANGNSKKEANENAPEKMKELPYKQFFLSTGAVLYSATLGALPQFFMARFKPQSSFVQGLIKYCIPGPVTAFCCAFNVMVIRSTEFESGIEVMDSKGNVIGVSQRAGEKAVKETALSRAAMFCTAIWIPDLTLFCLRRKSFLLQNPLFLNPLRSLAMISILGAMVPVSFSWLPQIGKIKRSDLEPELVSSTEETEFFFNKGL
ncbi:sideroflexin-4 [Elgaria multicarinata webbii]|uniref:sideroflexin-4 n=1 Tax=Elgaria multicarinata webbii TaxID=159646 RepID=UPI002FCD220C